MMVERSSDGGQRFVSRLRTVYFGTPDYAVPTLEALAGDPRFAVELVVTQPDRSAGRGQHVNESAVKRSALEVGVPVYQPVSLRTAGSRLPLESIGADLFVVVAYGLIFGKATLALPRLGCLNLHASLLPKFRGASPISAAILEGDDHTGVSLMQMDSGLDTGPVIQSSSVPVHDEATTGSLSAQLAAVAATMAIDAILEFASGVRQPAPQPSLGASLTRPLTKADGWIEWPAAAEVLERRVRAMSPWPKAWTTIGPHLVQIHAAHVVTGDKGAKPGQVVHARRELVVACGEGALFLESVQPAGGRPMSGGAFLSGRGIKAGDLFGIHGAPVRGLPLVVPISES
ncbi:MAG: methionyl-tRNA formyltransferase [Thermomicrobiales bacterium]